MVEVRGDEMCQLELICIKEGAVVFFFSSRRRHTRLQGDWSSDVCSSDLTLSCKLHITKNVDFVIMASPIHERYEK